MSKPGLELEDVRFAYPGGPTMRFEVTIPQGDFVAVMGPSGSGKSTLFSLVAGFETPTEGRISIAGARVERQPPARRPVSIVFQEHNLFAHIDVATNIGLGLNTRRAPDRDELAGIGKALEKVGLAGFERRMPPTLSGGERQRAALARALIRGRPLLLLDEPLAALGPRLRADMLALIRSLHDEAHLTTLMISHQPDDARAVSDKILFVDDGAVADFSPTEAMFSGEVGKAWADYLGKAERSATSGG